MRSQDRQEIVARYEARLASDADDRAVLATGTNERQKTRFDVLAQVGDLAGKRILDLGCGLGDFYAHLLDKGINVDYTGFDITPGFIERASTRFPNANFELRDIQESMPEERYDYAICSQVFNNKLGSGDNVEVVSDVMQRLFALTTSGVAIDMVTSFVDYQQDNLFYYDPMLMFQKAKEITRRVTLRHDYPLFEFCLYLLPGFDGWGKQ